MNLRTDIFFSFIGVAIMLLLIGTPMMSNSTPGVPYKGYPPNGYFTHGLYTTHGYYSNGHWYNNILLNETG